jgi:ribose 5-phosphate isomerase RpiB
MKDSPVTDALVNSIVEQVMAALRARGVAPPPPGAPRAAPPLAPRPADAAAGKVFLTAELLQGRLAAEAGDGRVVELAHNEFLTPAAMDVVEELHLTVRKAPQRPPAASEDRGGNPGGGLSSASPPGAAEDRPATLGLVIERPSEAVRGVLAGLGREAFSTVDYTQTDCWIANTRRLCEAILAGKVLAGVAILPYAADAMVLANKVRGIRAVQGSRLDSVAAAARHFAPNLLILEHTFSTYHEMRAMIRTFAAARPGEPQAQVLMETVAQLEKA